MSRKPTARVKRVLEIARQKSALESAQRKPTSTAPNVTQPSTGPTQKASSTLEKTKRFVSKKNLAMIRALPCFVCGGRPCDADHLSSRGAGGGDELANLQALCRLHHIERHQIGIKSFVTRYRTILTEIREKHELPPMTFDFLE